MSRLSNELDAVLAEKRGLEFRLKDQEAATARERQTYEMQQEALSAQVTGRLG